VSPLSAGEAKRLRSLHRRRSREREGLFLAEGVRVVEELLDAGLVLRQAVVSSSLEDTDRGARLAARLGAATDVRSVSESELAAVADTTTSQGVLVVAEVPASELEALRPTGASVVLVLDGVQDPGNLGTLARSASAFGCDALICLPGTVDPWNPKSVRGSAGAVFRRPVVGAEVEELGEWLDRHGYLLVGADAAGDSVRAAELPQRVALVVGNEGAGLGEDARSRCGRLVSVPMPGGTESLNVAVAGSILLYELTRGRA
jgi:TrmH family RNA methyltransferase